MEVSLRKVQLTDSADLFAWRNEPETIPWMGSMRALSLEEHQAWFNKTLTDPNCLWCIIEVSSEAIGQIRYHKSSDLNEDVAKVSINITHRMHGKGIASIAFAKGSRLVRELGFAKKIFAYVQVDNIGSIKAMEKAGFKRGEVKIVHDTPHLIMNDE